MLVDELLELARWYLQTVGAKILPKYQAVLQLIEYNASQSQKQPVFSELAGLQSDLVATDFSHLTVEQVRKLDALGAMQYLGAEGIAFLTKGIQTEQFDPSTAAGRLRTAVGTLSDINQRFQQLVGTLKSLKYERLLYEPDQHGAIIRAHFRGEAQIHEVKDWQKWSADWYDIACALVLVVDEKPVDVRVLGANTGIIIMVLGGSVRLVTMLAIVVKSLSGIVKDELQIANTLEDLRHNRFLNREIEAQITTIRKEKEESGIKEAMNAVKEKLGGQIQAGLEATVENAIRKYYSFYSKGGEVDIVAPLADGLLNVNDGPVSVKQIRDLNEAVAEIRSNQDALRLLTSQLAGTSSNE